MLNSIEQTITQGFPEGRPWIIDNIDEDLVNLSVARLVGLATSQTDIINSQVQTLLAQVNNLEAMKKTTASLPNDYLVPLAADSSGKALITDPEMVYDLVGAPISRLQSSPSDVDRLINFTQGLVNNSANVNISDSVVYEVSYTLPDGTKGSGYFEANYIPDPQPNPVNTLPVARLFVVSNANGLFYLNTIKEFPASKVKIDVVSQIASPPAYVGYDAYRLEIKNSDGTWESRTLPVYPVVTKLDLVQNFLSNPPTQQNLNEKYLYRLPDGTLNLIDSTGNSVDFRNAEGFVIPQSDSQITNWLGQASYQRLQKKLVDIKNDQVTFDLTDKTAVEWKALEGNVSGFAKLPAKSLANVNLLRDANDVKIGELALVEGRYFVKVSSYKSDREYSTFLEVKLDPDKAFQLFATTRDLIALKGAYSEVILKFTQRSAEQQLFLNQMMNKQNYQFDAATFVLKALREMQQKLANL